MREDRPMGREDRLDTGDEDVTNLGEKPHGTTLAGGQTVGDSSPRKVPVSTKYHHLIPSTTWSARSGPRGLVMEAVAATVRTVMRATTR
jgi:hypothetical protein